MRDRLDREATELLGLSRDRALEFPKPGGAYIGSLEIFPSS